MGNLKYFKTLKKDIISRLGKMIKRLFVRPEPD